MKNFLRTAAMLACSFFAITAFAQDGKIISGGSFELTENKSDELSAEQRANIIKMLQHNEAELRKQGKLPAIRPDARVDVATTLFSWPVKQATGYTDNGFYSISAYVDEDAGAGLLDYNCGNRTYNGHAGTDIALWPYGWQKMSENAVEVIAGAAGTILAKSNGNSDQSCAFCSTACDWNAIYIMHADGTVAWYGHFKNNSITSKLVGATVAAGEFLGIVGSSGNSTGPHLHFELYKNSTYTNANLIDPWALATAGCNAHGSPNANTTWWASQQNYRVSTLNKIMTSGSVPANVGGCSSGATAEASYEKTSYVKGDNIVFTAYYRDVQTGQSATNKIYRPNGTLWQSFTSSMTSNVSAYWTGQQYTLPTDALSIGTWRYEVVYNGNPAVNTNFTVSNTLPLTITNWNAAKSGKDVSLVLNTVNETNVSRINFLVSVNGTNYLKVASFAANNNSLNNTYIYKHTGAGKVNYYKAEVVNNDGSKTYSSVKNINFNTTGRLTVLGNPFINTLIVNVDAAVKGEMLQLINATGVVVYSKNLSATPNIVIETALLSSGVYQLVLKDELGNVERKTVIK